MQYLCPSLVLNSLEAAEKHERVTKTLKLADKPAVRAVPAVQTFFVCLSWLEL